MNVPWHLYGLFILDTERNLSSWSILLKALHSMVSINFIIYINTDCAFICVVALYNQWKNASKILLRLYLFYIQMSWSQDRSRPLMWLQKILYRINGLDVSHCHGSKINILRHFQCRGWKIDGIKDESIIQPNINICRL